MVYSNRKIVLINQAANYLTVDLCNAFAKRYDEVCLVAGGVHEQGVKLNSTVKIYWINKYRSGRKYTKLWNYIMAYIGIWFKIITKFRGYEVLFISTPPMNYLIGLFIPNKFSIVIWDVYPNAFKIIALSDRNILYKILCSLNRIVFSRATKIFTIGDVMSDILLEYTKRDKIIVQPLWSVFDSDYGIRKDQNPFVKEYGLEDKFIVQYSGNIGLTHNIELLIDLAEKLRYEDDILFMIIGKGPRVPIVREIINSKKLNNCILMPFQKDEMFPYSLSAADLGVVILDETVSKGSIPSKSYNLMAFGIPSLYITSTDSELFRYVDMFDHGGKFSRWEIHDAATFILDLSKDYNRWQGYSINSIKASEMFRRTNADKLVMEYCR